MTTTTQTPEEKIIQIMDHLNDMKLGRRFQIHCPFCRQFNQRGAAMSAPDEWKRIGVSPFCCDGYEIVVRELCGVGEEAD